MTSRYIIIAVIDTSVDPIFRVWNSPDHLVHSKVLLRAFCLVDYSPTGSSEQDAFVTIVSIFLAAFLELCFGCFRTQRLKWLRCSLIGRCRHPTVADRVSHPTATLLSGAGRPSTTVVKIAAIVCRQSGLRQMLLAMFPGWLRMIPKTARLIRDSCNANCELCHWPSCWASLVIVVLELGSS